MTPKILLFALLLAEYAFSASTLDANVILKQSRERDDGKDYLSSVTLNTYSDKKLVNFRKFYLLQKDESANELMTIAIKQPADVRDVSFLIRSLDEKAAKDDEQWMYLPAFRKVRRISAKDKRGSFMGSEYSYYDLDKLRVSDFTSTLLKEESIDGRDAYVIERTPTSQDIINKSGYHKLIVWIDKKNNLILQQDYYDAKGILFKRYTSDNVEKIEDIWTITQSTMENLVENKESVMIFHETRYNQNLEAKLFRLSKLKRGIKEKDVDVLTKISDL